MYLGVVVEFGPSQMYSRHPFTRTEALLSAVPVPDPAGQGVRIVLEGTLPSATEIPRGCPFSTRCPRRIGAICDETPPPEQPLADGHYISCHIPAEELARLQSAEAGARE
jgi:peptide/nickel transport system ATP-binding protein